MIRPRLSRSIAGHEGFRATVYDDHLENPTIGYGTRIGEIELDEGTALTWLVAEVDEKLGRLLGVVGFSEMDDVRQDVILEMAYQIGVGGCLRFRRMWSAIRHSDWGVAADEMLDSRWAREQTPTRAQTLAARMRRGEWEGTE